MDNKGRKAVPCRSSCSSPTVNVTGSRWLDRKYCELSPFRISALTRCKDFEAKNRKARH